MSSQVSLFTTSQKSVPVFANNNAESSGRKEIAMRDKDSFQSYMKESTGSNYRLSDNSSHADRIEKREEQHANKDQSNQPETTDGNDLETDGGRVNEANSAKRTDKISDAADAYDDSAPDPNDTGTAGETGTEVAEDGLVAQPLGGTAVSPDSHKVAEPKLIDAPQSYGGTHKPDLRNIPNQDPDALTVAPMTPASRHDDDTASLVIADGDSRKTDHLDIPDQTPGALTMDPVLPASPPGDAPGRVIADGAGTSNGKESSGHHARAEMVPGLQVKAAVSGASNPGEANIAAIANSPGQSKKFFGEPEHVAARKELPQAIYTPTASNHAQRSTGASLTTAVSSVQTAMAQNPTLQSGKSGEAENIRWMKEAGFSSNAAGVEMPATSRLQQATLLQQPDLPRNVAVQLAQGMRQGNGGKPMELVLSPAELGRVRISMTASDGAMTVHVVAERPETLDLMRRHIDVLAQEFHDIGYGSANFAFGQNEPEGGTSSNNGPGPDGQTPSTNMNAPESDGATPSQSSLTIETDRVDIRL